MSPEDPQAPEDLVELEQIRFRHPLVRGDDDHVVRKNGRVVPIEAAVQESVAVYRQQVLVAFAEVEDNLIALRTLDGQAQSTRDALTSAGRAARIAQVRYDTGATSYLDVIEAQRTLLTVQRLDTQIRGSRANSTVALIRALGGGWDSPTTLSDSGQVH